MKEITLVSKVGYKIIINGQQLTLKNSQNDSEEFEVKKSQDTDRHARKRPKGNQKNQGQDQLALILTPEIQYLLQKPDGS